MENKQNIKELSWYIFNKYMRENFNVKDSLIKHSITTAKICEEMSIYSNKNIDTNLAFACGLLHDIGKIKSKSTGLMHTYE
ncbi:MAG: HD domain-containing protein, partial [Geminicoccaceae bacterium]|nr:HD domain-containing protein [Geminicoccaceae bacterium]